MMSSLCLLVVVMSFIVGVTNAELEYLPNPSEVWKSSASEAQAGNGLFVTPDGKKLIGTFADGSVRFYNPVTGDETNSFTPERIGGASTRGLGGITFSYGGAEPYMVYAVTDDAFNPAAKTRAIALDTDGNKLFESVPFPGVQAGKPETTSNGQYIMMNHNVDQSVGFFSILDTDDVVDGELLNATYTKSNPANPFSPIGVAHSPVEGYYDGGEGNTNDLFVWGFDFAKGAKATGIGQIFAYQKPMIGDSMDYMLLGESKNFQTNLAPTFANSGLSMYWTVSRAQQRCWVGKTSPPHPNRFNRAQTKTASFDRGNPPFIAARAGPSFNSNKTHPVVYGPGASNELWRMNFDYSEDTVVKTSFVISSKVAVSPQDDVIYYATQAGEVVQADAVTLKKIWKFDINAPILADITLNDDGTLLYVADAIGNVRGYRVAESDAIAQSTTAPTTVAPTTAQPSTAVPSTVSPDPGAASLTDAPTDPSTVNQQTEASTNFPLVRTTAPTPSGGETSGSSAHPVSFGLLCSLLVPATYVMVLFL